MAVLSSQLRLSLVDNVSRPIRAISAQLSAFQQRQRAMMAPIMGMGGGLLALGGGYLAVTRGLSGTAGAAMDFESAMSDVRKVLDVNDEQFANIRRQVLGLSKELPVTAEGVASIFAAAGQANIPVEELGRFSEMVSKVAVAWEVAEADTSETLAKIKSQMSMSVEEIALYADAVNHLSNNTAAAAPDLVGFGRIVAGTGEMYGYSAQQTLAFGGAMIASGAQTEVAATSFRNMGRALTIGARATKSHDTAFSRLGLNAVRTAKDMQKDALGTTLKVIEKIQELPEWERISIASALFGDEARALMPIINNSSELRRQLGLVGDEADYAGSAFEEYEVRAKTTANTLQLVKNNFRAVGIEMGQRMLPGINEALQGTLDLFASLGDRVSPLKQLEAVIGGFTQGLGYDGGIREMVQDLSDLLFGEVDPANGADRLGQLFERFRQWGQSVREFNDAIRDNPIAQFLADMAGNGLKFVMAAFGIGILAGAIMKLGRALLFLSGASAAWGILKWLAKFRPPKLPGLPGGKPNATPTVMPPAGKATPSPADKPSGAAKPGPWNPAAPTTAPTPRGPTGTPIYRPPVPAPIMDLPTTAPAAATGVGAALKSFFGKGGLIATGLLAAGEWGIEAGLEATANAVHTPEARAKADDKTGGADVSTFGNLWRLLQAEALNIQRQGAAPEDDVNGVRRAIQEFGGNIGPAVTAPPSDVATLRDGINGVRQAIEGLPSRMNLQQADDGSTMLPPIHVPLPQEPMQLPEVMRTQSVGTSEVRMVNPPPRPNVSTNVTVNVTTNADPQAIGRAVGAEVSKAAEGYMGDGPY